VECEAVRDLLAEHLLGSLADDQELAVRRHVRGCSTCRQELRAMSDGLGTFAHAAHETAPPSALRDQVLEALAEDRADGRAQTGRPRVRWSTLAMAAVLVLLAGSLAWAAVATSRAAHLQAEAGRYGAFLETLGGKDVRVGSFHRAGRQTVQGSVVMYDSNVGQSWVLVLVHAPGAGGSARVMLSSRSGSSSIEMRALRFDEGEASSWLVTSADISRFDRCTLLDSAGHRLASAVVSGE
jgi:predicted anti-sigma-YlaC factor YlaD